MSARLQCRTHLVANSGLGLISPWRSGSVSKVCLAVFRRCFRTRHRFSHPSCGSARALCPRSSIFGIGAFMMKGGEKYEPNAAGSDEENENPADRGANVSFALFKDIFPCAPQMETKDCLGGFVNAVGCEWKLSPKEKRQ